MLSLALADRHTALELEGRLGAEYTDGEGGSHGGGRPRRQLMNMKNKEKGALNPGQPQPIFLLIVYPPLLQCFWSSIPIGEFL